MTTPPNNEINCPSTCAFDFPQDGSVTLHAVANGTDVFVGWSSADAGFTCAGTGDCTVTMDMARNVTATFQPTQPLHITRAGTPGGTVTSTPAGINCGAVCDFVYEQGTGVLLHADGGTNAIFSGWSGDVVSCPGSADCMVTMDQARSVTATFSPILHQLAITKTGGTGTGTVTSLTPNTGIDCGTTCQWDFQQGTAVVLHATADAGSTFVSWSDAGCPGTGDCTVTMDVAKSVNAVFNLVGGGTITFKDSDPAIAYNGWLGVADGAANGGFYRMSSVKNDKATWKSPATTSITWVTRTGPDQGKASGDHRRHEQGHRGPLCRGARGVQQGLLGPEQRRAHHRHQGAAHEEHRLEQLQGQAGCLRGGRHHHAGVRPGDPVRHVEEHRRRPWATDGTYRSATAATATVTVTFTGTVRSTGRPRRARPTARPP